MIQTLLERISAHSWGNPKIKKYIKQLPVYESTKMIQDIIWNTYKDSERFCYKSKVAKIII